MSTQMQSLPQVAIATKVHYKIAAHAFPNGAGALCENCGSSRLMSHDDLVNMMVKGFPRCCGQRMQVEAIK